MTIIRAVNKKTGQVFEGTVDEARKFGFSDEFILDKLKTSQELEKATGASSTTIKNTEDIKKATSTLAAGEKTKVDDSLIFAQEVKSALDKLNSAESGGLPGASGPLTNLLSGAAGAIGVDTPEAALKDQLRNLVQLIRKERTGVAFSPEEQKELTDIFGSLKTQEGPLKRKLQDLLSRSVNELSVKGNLDRNQLDQVFGVSQEAQPEKKEGLLQKLILDPYKTTAGNIGALGQVGLSSLVGKFNPQAGAQLAQEGQFGQNVAERSKMASENPLQALFEQGLASADIYGQAMGLKGLGNLTGARVLGGQGFKNSGVANLLSKGKNIDVAGNVVKAGETIERNTPKAIIGRAQQDAARNLADVKINNKSILNVGEKMVKKVPALEKTFEKYKPLIESAKTPEDLLEVMDFLGDAFTQSQKTARGLSPKLLKTMYKAAIDELKVSAPEVYKYRSLMRFTYEVPKAAGSALWKATLGKYLVKG